MENNPEAAAQATEAQPTNTSPSQPEAPAEASAEAKPEATDAHGFTGEQLAEMQKFIEANGGYDKAFKTFKERISNPAQETPKEEPAQQSAQPQAAAEEQAKAPQTPAGYMTPQEFMASQYYNSLAGQEEYAPIADKIRSGEMFKEMAKFGIRPMDQQGNINDSQVREFFSLYAKTIPTKPAQTPAEAAAPTVDYIPVNNGKVDSIDQAARIIAQSSSLKAQGLAEHPDLAAAEAFFKDALSGKKK